MFLFNNSFLCSMWHILKRNGLAMKDPEQSIEFPFLFLIIFWVLVYSQTYNVQINLVFTAVFKNLVSINLLKYNKLLEVYCYFNFHRCSNFFLKGKPTNKHSKRIIHASLISAFNFNLLS